MSFVLLLNFFARGESEIHECNPTPIHASWDLEKSRGLSLLISFTGLGRFSGSSPQKKETCKKYEKICGKCEEICGQIRISHVFLHIFHIFPQIIPSSISFILNLLAKPKNKDHVSCLHFAPRTPLRSMLRLWPVFEEAGEPGISPSPKAYIEGEWSEFFCVPTLRQKLGIFWSHRAYMEEIEEWHLAGQQAVF